MNDFLWSDREITQCDVYQFYALIKMRRKYLIQVPTVSFPVCLKRASRDVILAYVPNTVGKVYHSKVFRCMFWLSVPW